MAVKKTDVDAIVKHVKSFRNGNFKGLKEIMNIVENYDGEEGELLKEYRYELKDCVKEAVEHNDTSALLSSVKTFGNIEKKMEKNKDLKKYAKTLVDPVVKVIDSFVERR